MRRKGMTMALTLIVAALVLIVVGLLVITITSGSLTSFLEKVGLISGESSCDIAKVNYCIAHPTATSVTGETLDACGSSGINFECENRQLK